MFLKTDVIFEKAIELKLEQVARVFQELHDLHGDEAFVNVSETQPGRTFSLTITSSVDPLV